MSDSEHQQFQFDKARRSSILKPVKIDNRAPLQELGACSDDTTATSSSIYKKRVSFHVVNIKEFSTHAQTQEVQKNPAYNEFLSSMSDSSRNNTNSECSNFSPMIPAIIIPPDEDKENQINYGDDTDSLVEEDDEPFDLSTRYNKHEEPRNFLESTKMSHCNTIMSTFNISGIQDLDETSMRALDDDEESDADDSFQRMIDQQLGKQAGMNFMLNVAGENVSSGENMFFASHGGRKSLAMQSARHEDFDDNAELPSVPRKSLAMQSARHEDSDDNVELSSVPRKSFAMHSTRHEDSNELPSVPRKSLAMQSARHEDSDSTVEPIHPALADLNESDQEPRIAPPRRKSFAPRKSVNFRNRDLDSSGEMEFTCAFPAMARPPVEEENDGSEMEETEVFPRKYVGPRQSTELNIPDKGDFMWRRSLPNKTNLTKSMETSNTSQLDLESRKSTGMNNLQNVFPQQYDQDSSMELTTFVPLKSLRKSVGRMMLKTSEHLDESGMEITEVLHGLPSNAHMDDTRSEEYDVSMSEAISDMEISSYSPPNVTTTNQSMMTVDQTKPNVSADDSNIATGGLNRKSLGPRIQNNENLKIKHLARYPTSTSTHLQHKSFSGFENSAMDLSTAPSRKSAPICIVPAQHDENETLPQSTSEDGSPNISVSVGVPITSMNAEQHRVNPNMVLNSSVNDQSLQTTDIHSILPMAHSTNLNLTETKSSPVAKATTKQNLASENHFNVTSESNPNKSAVNMSMSMESTCTLPQSTELVSNKMDNSNMELSSVINQKSTREFNLTATDETTGETNTCQQTTQSKRENTNMSVNDISIDKSVACEDMSLAETMTIHVNETCVTGAILPETEVLVSDVKENSTNPSQFESDSAVMSSSSGESKDNSVSTVLSEGTTGNNDENEQPNMNTTKLENKSDKTESKKVLQVSVDDGFSSTQNSRQSLESALSTSCVLDISKMSCDLVQVERPRKRPSDGFEVHDENLVQDENKMVVANPKKRSKTFEVDIEDKEGNEVEINSENMAKESEETTTTKQSFHSHSMITPVKTPIQLVQTPTMVTNFTETVDKPFTFATPAKTHVVKSTPNKTSTFVTPVQVANKTPQFITPSNNLTFRTPGKTPIKTPTLTTPGRAPATEADVNFSHESLHSSNVSTYANPSSTLTDSVINNLTDKEIPLPGSTIKQTPSEMKAKQHQSASCSTPLLPNSCNKNVIVDMFFQSFNKTHDKPEGFSAPSKNIIKKLIMTQEKQKQTIEEETTSDENKSASQDASPENASLDINPTLKRTKDQLNISEHNDLNSSNYIPEKQQRNVMSDIGDVVKDNVVCLNISEQSDIGDVVKDISVLDISGEGEKLTQIQAEFELTMNISGPQPNQSVHENEKHDESNSSNKTSGLKDISLASLQHESVHDNEKQDESNSSNKTSGLKDISLASLQHESVHDESNSPNKTSGLKDISMASLQHESPEKQQTQVVEVQNSETVEATIDDVPVDNQSMDLNSSEVDVPKEANNSELQEGVYMSKTPSIETHLDEDKSHNESIDASIVAETSFNLRKRRKSRLSIVPKQSTVETTIRQMDTKRKTLKIAPKKSVMRKSLVCSEDEVEDQGEQKILAEENKGNTEWKSKSLESELWEFEFFFQGLIVLKIEFNPVCKNNSQRRRPEKTVKRITFETNEDAPIKYGSPLPPNSDVLRVCYSLLQTKYPPSRLSEMCHTSSDVLQLLHHVSPFINYLVKFARSLHYCHLKYGMKLDGTTATINITSWDKLEYSQVSVNLNNIHFITNNDIHVKKMFGNLAESDVRRQFPIFSTKEKPTFMRTFIENIHSFMNKTN